MQFADGDVSPHVAQLTITVHTNAKPIFSVISTKIRSKMNENCISVIKYAQKQARRSYQCALDHERQKKQSKSRSSPSIEQLSESSRNSSSIMSGMSLTDDDLLVTKAALAFHHRDSSTNYPAEYHKEYDEDAVAAKAVRILSKGKRICLMGFFGVIVIGLVVGMSVALTRQSAVDLLRPVPSRAHLRVSVRPT